MLRNVASQKYRVYAWDTTTGLAKTGDAANITAYITKDDGTPAATNDVNPTEASSTNEPGYYDFDLTQAETAAAKISLSPKSATANIQVIACPPVVYTVPQYHSLNAIDSNGRGDISRVSGTAQTAGDLSAQIDAVDNFVDTEIAAILSDTSGISTILTTLGTGGDGLTAITDLIGAPSDLGGGATLADMLAAIAGTTFDGATDSNEALRNWIGDGTNLTAAGSVVVATGTFTGTPTSTVMASTLTEADGFWDDCLIRITSGSLAGQVRPIASFANTGGTITLDEALTSAPSPGNAFSILGFHVHPISQIADGVLDEATSGHTTAGTLGKAISDILADTAELQGDWADGGRLDLIIDELTSQGDTNETKLDTIDNFVDTEIAAIIAAIGTPSDLGGGATLAGNLADIEAQTDDIGSAGAGLTALATAAELAKVPKSDGSASWNATALAAIQAEAVDALQETIPDTVPAVGSRPNMQQAVRMALQGLSDFRYLGDKYTVFKEDGSTTLIEMTTDDATNPTLAHRTT